jgi:hypothetical protein
MSFKRRVPSSIIFKAHLAARCSASLLLPAFPDAISVLFMKSLTEKLQKNDRRWNSTFK